MPEPLPEHQRIGSQHNEGYLVAGTSADRSEFAVDAICLWWEDPARPTFPDESNLLNLSDAGASDGCRYRLWQRQLQEELANRLGIEVMVCHYPTGASKWNLIEHRLFSNVSINSAGKPLRTFETMLGCIRDTTMETELKVKAYSLDQVPETGLKVSDKEMKALNLHRRSVCPAWYYVIRPRHAPL